MSTVPSNLLLTLPIVDAAVAPGAAESETASFGDHLAPPAAASSSNESRRAQSGDAHTEDAERADGSRPPGQREGRERQVDHESPAADTATGERPDENAGDRAAAAVDDPPRPRKSDEDRTDASAEQRPTDQAPTVEAALNDAPVNDVAIAAGPAADVATAPADSTDDAPEPPDTETADRPVDPAVERPVLSQAETPAGFPDSPELETSGDSTAEQGSTDVPKRQARSIEADRSDRATRAEASDGVPIPTMESVQEAAAPSPGKRFVEPDQPSIEAKIPTDTEQEAVAQDDVAAPSTERVPTGTTARDVRQVDRETARDAAGRDAPQEDPAKPSPAATSTDVDDGARRPNERRSKRASTERPTPPGATAKAVSAGSMQSPGDSAAAGAIDAAMAPETAEIDPRTADNTLPDGQSAQAKLAGTSPDGATAPAANRLPLHLASRLAGQSSDAPRISNAQQVRLVERVARAFRAAADGDRPIRLRLSPPNLGSLRLEVKVEGNVLTARIEAESAQARAVLLDNMAELRQRLSEQSIRVEHFDVDLMNRQGQGSFEQAGRDKSAGSPAAPAGTDGDETAEEEDKERRQGTPFLHEGKLNVVV